jgi:hypothetical protein
MTLKPLALVVLLVLPLPALAQRAPDAAAPRAIVPTPLQDLPSDDGLMARAERLWGSMLDGVGFSLGTSSYARAHAAASRQQTRDDFTWLMDIAGYKLKEIESSVGLIPSLSLTFGQARELTEADREYVERALERHARRNPGPISALQRTIVRGIMEAGELRGFSVDKVEVDLFPLPRVKFQLSPSDAPLGVEASRIMRAIERLNNRVGAMAAARPGAGRMFDLPRAAPLLPATELRH